MKVPNDHPLRAIEGLSGKTVTKVEVGFCEERHDVHQSEYIIIHCSDGDKVKLTIGTNLREFGIDGRLGIKENRLFRVKCGKGVSYRNAAMTRIRKCSKLRNPKALRLMSLILLLMPSTTPLVVR